MKAVSVSLPTWKATVGYEEGEDWVLSKMKTGYPRFFIHLTIQELQGEILRQYGGPGEATMLFPSRATARICQHFICDKLDKVRPEDIRITGLVPISRGTSSENQTSLSRLYCVFFPQEHFGTAKQVWQHSGSGISSRRGEFCLKALKDGLLVPEEVQISQKDRCDPVSKGPRRYQQGGSLNGFDHASRKLINSPRESNNSDAREGKECSQFVEERFGRNLNAELASKAKLAIRRRIAGCLISDSDLDQALDTPSSGPVERAKGITHNDVYLYPTGMNSIFNAHQILMASYGDSPKSVCFGFPYIDTLKVLQKWGAGCLFYGGGDEADLDDLERRLQHGERYLALFTEFPSNPLLSSPNLHRIRALADNYDFAVVVDETVGNFINLNVLTLADIVVSSLTKIFSGDSNVMGGSLVVNPQSRRYSTLKQTLETVYEDDYWAEDAVFMERNSRDFISRIERINETAEAIAEQLQQSPIVKQVYYPSHRESLKNYDACRNPRGGYGGLLSVTFQEVEQAVAFFDALLVQKGPSLGTNFTLSCPYTILAHYGELEWAARFGVEADLIRISFGLEDRLDLHRRVERALEAAARAATG